MHGATNAWLACRYGALAHGATAKARMNSYQDLFDAYVKDMREAIADARRWWEALLAIETVRCGDAVKARIALEERWPFGIAAHPYVIGVYRFWSLECQRFNEIAEFHGRDESDYLADEDDWGMEDAMDDSDEATMSDLAAVDGPIEPRELLVDMLPGRADDVAEVMVDFVFDPRGLDENDRWV